MRKVLLGLGLFGLTMAGCATSAQIEREARLHDMRADAAARIRDYDRASAEKSEAERLHAKAVKKAVNEGNTSGVVIPTAPTEVPHDPAPLEAP